jgi:peptidoglycan/LPS O-acetylase OafA/YrhL
MSRNIPSLDGLRAFSILLVILAHAAWFLPHWLVADSAFQLVVGNGYHGVTVFFVISGFLITTLLLREFDKTNSISLKRFYLRRTLRIFPPFYFFLGVMALLWAAHLIPEDPASFLASLTYTWAYDPHAHGYFITHTWSLSIEEQFYLFWPVLFVVLHRREKLISASVFLILVMPVLRVLFYFVLPSLRGHEFYMVQGWIDTMMVGCLLALLRHRGIWSSLQRRYTNRWAASVMFLVAFFLNPYLLLHLPKKEAGLFALAFAPTITAFCIGGILLYVIDTKDGLVFGILNHSVVRHIGVLSYSLYLWQQLFVSQELHLLPYGFLLMIVAAELSFWCVERPSLKLRPRLETLWLPSNRKLTPQR